MAQSRGRVETRDEPTLTSTQTIRLGTVAARLAGLPKCIVLLPAFWRLYGVLLFIAYELYLYYSSIHNTELYSSIITTL